MKVFEDHRGTIEDLIGPVDSVTRIHTKKDAVRGNHYHAYTVQWTYVTKGALLMADAGRRKIISAGEMMIHPPGIPHAWKAVEDTDCLVFTRGPRSGEDYEKDTIRLADPLLS